MATEVVDGESAPLERLGSGRAAEVFAWEPGVVVKLAREPQFEAELEREAASLEAAAAAGIVVPRPLGFVEHQGRRGLLMERIDGKDMFSIIESQPWRVWQLASLFGRLHVQLGESTAPDSVAKLKDHAKGVFEESVRIPAAARERLLAVLEAAPDGDRLCHLDLHPGNVMLSGKDAFIIDFPNALRGPSIADHAKTWVIFNAGQPTQGMGRTVRVMIAVFRKLALRGYTRAYRSASDIDETALARWKAVQVAVRLDEGIATERRQLLRLLSPALREAEQLAT